MFNKTMSRLWILVGVSLTMTLAACETVGSSSDSTGINTSGSTSGSSAESSSASSDSSSSDETSTVDVAIKTLTIHYHGDTVNYGEWCYWLWEDGGDGKIFYFDGTDDYGAYGSYDATQWTTRAKLNFIIRKKTTWDGQTSDRVIKYADYDLSEAGELHVYVLAGESELFKTSQDALGNRITAAYFSSWSNITVETTAAFVTYELYIDGIMTKTGSGGSSPQVIALEGDVDLAKLYAISVKFEATDSKWKVRAVGSSKLYDTAKFTTDYVYSGNDLGVTYTAAASTFKLWAPTSSSVSLRVFGVGTPASISGNALYDAYNEYTMSRGNGGVWSTRVDKDLAGKYYTYVVTNSSGTNEVVDPYAKAAGVNGLRGQILNFATYNPEGWNESTYSDIKAPTDLTVYEMHVRDLTADATWTGTEANRGKYLGLSESGTTYTENDITVKTGFDHIKELGVNAVQLMPFFDQANNELLPSYNWGYNPLNYNVLEGAYSSVPKRGEVRIQEFKQMVKSYADQDIRMIMDVVYNHVSAASSSNFSLIVPGYYFRYNADGSYSNGSGCGNDTASERSMFRKFIVDSVCFWASEYHIKGFRFDLMGLIDTTTMNAVKEALSAIDPDIVVYGEPWAAGSTASSATLSTTSQVYSTLVGVGGFNDAGRNGLRGENSWSGNQYGWMQKGETDNKNDSTYINRVKGMMAGMTGNYYDYNQWDPSKTVNYASCHDNLTLYDQLSGTVGATDAPKASVAVNSTVLFSQGIAFIQGGEEIMRSKRADDDDAAETFYTINGVKISHNSYMAGDSVNAYKWNNKVTYKAYFDKYVEAIALRKSYSGFRLSSASNIARQGIAGNETLRMGFWDGALAFSTIAGWYTGAPGETSSAVYVFVNAREVVTTGTLNSIIAWGTADVKVLYDSTGVRAINSTISNTVTLSAYSVLVVQRLD
jgi:pullulanase